MNVIFLTLKFEYVRFIPIVVIYVWTNTSTVGWELLKVFWPNSHPHKFTDKYVHFYFFFFFFGRVLHLYIQSIFRVNWKTCTHFIIIFSFTNEESYNWYPFYVWNTRFHAYESVSKPKGLSWFWLKRKCLRLLSIVISRIYYLNENWLNV